MGSKGNSIAHVMSPPTPNVMRQHGLRIETPMVSFPESPDPSPADEPPPPTPYSLPWTPDLSYPVLDSSPDHAVPSPAGLPPGSHFRYTMPPPTTARKPLAEVPRTASQSKTAANVDLVETVLRLKDDLATSNVTLNIQRRENESLNLEVQKGKKIEQELRAHVMEIESKLQTAQTEAAAFKSQAKIERLQQLHNVKTDYEKKLKEMEESSRRDKLEMDRLLAIIKEGSLSKKKMDDANANLDEYVAKVESEKKRLEEQLSAMNKMVDSLRNMNTHQDDVAAVQKDYDREIQRVIADAAERENRLAVEKDRLAMQVETLKAEVNEAASANAHVETLQAALDDKTKALKEAHSKYAQLRSERDTLEKDFTRVRRSAMKPSPNADLKTEIERLKEALSEANSRCEDLIAERSALVRNKGSGKELRQTVSEDQSDAEVPDRLGRIRDAAERSQLMQEHRREIARLKAEHEGERKRISEAHDQEIKEVFEEAKAEVSARARESRRRLKREFETKIAAMERSHQVELAKVRSKCWSQCSLLCSMS
jgi:chromosome segregation ATPase